MINKWINVEKDCVLLVEADDVRFPKRPVQGMEHSFWCNGVPIVTQGKFKVKALPGNTTHYLAEGNGGYRTHAPYAMLTSMESNSQYTCVVNLKQDMWYDREVLVLDENDVMNIDPVENSIEHYIYAANSEGYINGEFVQQDQFFSVNNMDTIELTTSNDKLVAGQRRYFIRLWRTEGNEPWM
jgi:hypothetical protein